MAKRKSQQSRVLLVSLDELKQLKEAGVWLSFSFAMQGLYAVHSNISQCKELLNRA